MEKPFIEQLIDENNEEKLKEELKTHNFEEDAFPVLFYALTKGSPRSLLKILLDNGCTSQTKETYDDKSILQFALFKRVELDTIRFLISNGADPKVKDPLDESTLLHDCVEQKLPIEYVEFFATYIPVTSVNEYGESALTYALSSDIMDFELLTFLIKEGSDLETKNDENKTPLHIACEHDVERDLIELMIKKGSNLKAKDSYGNVPISYLMPKKMGQRTLEIFCENGQDISVQDNFGNTLLHWSCLNNLQVFDFLVDSGLDIKITNNNGETCLHNFLRNPHCELSIIKRFIDFDLDLNLLSKSKETALHCALSLDAKIDEKIVRLLIEKTDLTLLTPEKENFLHFAILHNQSLSIINFLIEKGLKINETTEKMEQTCLHYACKQTKINLELIKLLIKNGADCSMLDKENGYPLHYALQKNYGKSVVPFELIKLLFKNGMDLNINLYTTFYSGTRTAFMYYSTTLEPKKEIIDWFISKGSKIEKPENKNLFLYWCIQNNCDFETLQYLVQNNFYIPKLEISNHDSPTILLASMGKIKELNLLLESGLDINSNFGYHKKPITHFAIKSNMEMLEFIVSKGIDLDLQDNNGNTALHEIIILNLEFEKFHYLVKKGASLTNTNNKSNTPLLTLITSGWGFAVGEQKKMQYLEMFRNLGIDYKEVDLQTRKFLSKAIQFECTLNVIKFFIENGVRFDPEVEIVSDSPLLSALEIENRDMATLLINYGSKIEDLFETYAKENYQQNYYFSYTSKQFITKENIQHMEKFRTYQQDFAKLYEKSLYTDYEVRGIKIHKLFIEARLHQKLTEELITKMEKEITKEELEEFFRILYSGIEFRNVNLINEKKKFLKSIVNTLQLDEKVSNCYQRNSLTEDMKLLLEDEESMDFSIVVEDDYIPCHKFVLVARSGLYAQLFETIDSGIGEVNDYSGKSYETIELLIDYFYTDTIKFTGDNDVEFLLDELDDAHLYYQLNTNSSLVCHYECQMSMLYGKKWKNEKQESQIQKGEAEN
ncbi:ankyrin repeat ph and sec7 domain containing protein secg-related [Anaeramoeba flamelloides]|uniref:Ankyrin repeat ph and sec7 domain containing protein secg-related n=1 Tax=Anaeramoeba flamelloides TaxID=1746091 RepID=A0AAV7Y4D0_9EUKA|nr:ankyrin repeat ph and sec7 domain containing protein secg-related [Anaeramoeba flamelloides]